jgi:methionyl-tRNA formyltransferase
MDFSLPAMTIYNRWRGFQPWPGAWTMLDGKKLIAHRMMPFEAGALAESSSTLGEVHVEQDRLFVACGERGWIEIVELQLEGKRRMNASEFLRGNALKTGDRL